MFWRWLTVIGLAMTPNLILGQPAAIAAGLRFEMNRWVVVIVVAIASFVEGLIVMRVAGAGLRLPRLHRWLGRYRTPRALAWCDKWGPWGGLMLGAAVVGTEPIIIALKTMSVEDRRIVAPLAVSSAVYSGIYYAVVVFGVTLFSRQMNDLEQIWNLL